MFNFSRVRKIISNINHQGSLRSGVLLSSAKIIPTASNASMGDIELYHGFQTPSNDIGPFNELLDEALEVGDLALALNVYDSIRTSDTIPNIVTFHLLLATAACLNAQKEAFAFWREMTQVYRFSPDELSYTFLLQASAGAKDVEGVEEVWDRLVELKRNTFGREEGDGPGRESYQAYIKAQAELGSPARVIAAYREMKAAGLVMEKDLYQSVFRAVVSIGDTETARELMAERESAADVAKFFIECNALLHSFADAGDLDGAFTVFKDMRALAYRPNAATWEGLIRAAELAGEKTTAFRIFQERKRYGTGASDAMATSLLNLCSKPGEVDIVSALSVLQDRTKLTAGTGELSDLGLPTRIYQQVLAMAMEVKDLWLALAAWDVLVADLGDLDEEHASAMRRIRSDPKSRLGAATMAGAATVAGITPVSPTELVSMYADAVSSSPSALDSSSGNGWAAESVLPIPVEDAVRLVQLALDEGELRVGYEIMSSLSERFELEGSLMGGVPASMYDLQTQIFARAGQLELSLAAGRELLAAGGAMSTSTASALIGAHCRIGLREGSTQAIQALVRSITVSETPVSALHAVLEWLARSAPKPPQSNQPEEVHYSTEVDKLMKSLHEDVDSTLIARSPGGYGGGSLPGIAGPETKAGRAIVKPGVGSVVVDYSETNPSVRLMTVDLPPLSDDAPVFEGDLDEWRSYIEEQMEDKLEELPVITMALTERLARSAGWYDLAGKIRGHMLMTGVLGPFVVAPEPTARRRRRTRAEMQAAAAAEAEEQAKNPVVAVKKKRGRKPKVRAVEEE